MSATGKKQTIGVKCQFMTEIVGNKTTIACFHKKVLVALRPWVNLRDVGNDMYFIGYLTGFINHQQSFFGYVRPWSCYAMLMPTF